MIYTIFRMIYTIFRIKSTPPPIGRSLPFKTIASVAATRPVHAQAETQPLRVQCRAPLIVNTIEQGYYLHRAFRRMTY